MAASLTALADEPAAPVTPEAPALPAPIVEFQHRQNYQPTILHSLQEVLDLFNMERPLDHGSQCHERAEVWSHDMAANLGYKLMKVMMFYTPRFRATYRHDDDVYKWWYHTAPVVYTDLGSGPVAYVLDREFVPQPMTLDEWSYYFLHDEIAPNNNNIPFVNNILSGQYLTHEQTHCQVISNFREYAVPALTGKMDTPWCMMRIYPMYYMQPDDVMQMDCDPRVDPDYTLGLTGRGFFHPARGAAILDKFVGGQLNGHYKSVCPKGDPNVLYDFRKSDLDVAYRKASQRDPDPRTGR